MSEPVYSTETPVEADPAAQPDTPTDWEAEAKKWEKRSKDNFAKLKEAQPKLAELDQIKAANQTEAEKLTSELTRWQTEAETWRGQAVGSRIQAIASDLFADPSDAVEALSSSNYLDAGGQINEDAIKADLAGLLERKPHWAKSSGGPATPRPPAPNLHQGSGGGTPVSSPGAEFAAILQSQLGGG